MNSIFKRIITFVITTVFIITSVIPIYAKEENTDEVIQKCIDAGLTVGAWTVNEPEAVDRLASLGVEYITTDNITY